MTAINEKNMHCILEHLALQQAADRAQHGLDHGSTICRLPVRSWPAEVIRRKPDMPMAWNPMGFRHAMKDPSIPVIFIPGEAVLTREVIERICIENPLRKMIIWETV